MSDIAKYIDHTVLKADASEQKVIKLCEEAIAHKFASVCVNGCRAALVAKLLKGSGVKTCVVVGFPLGAMTTPAKAFEAQQAVAEGAEEIDMVINIGWLKDGKSDLVEADIKAVANAIKGKAHLKVIIETCLLTDEEKVAACKLAVKAGADYVKTSTGFSSGGATEQDIALMRKTVGPKIGVKASGGVSSYQAARAMISAGATRIGASAGIKILEEEERESK